MMGGREGANHPRPFTEALILPGSGGRCRPGEPACQHPGTPSSPLYPSPPYIPFFLRPSVPDLTAFPHSSDKMAGREEEEEEGRKSKTQLRRVGQSPPLKP